MCSRSATDSGWRYAWLNLIEMSYNTSHRPGIQLISLTHIAFSTSLFRVRRLFQCDRPNWENRISSSIFSLCFALGLVPHFLEDEKTFSPLLLASVVPFQANTVPFPASTLPFQASILTTGKRQNTRLYCAPSSSFWLFFVMVLLKQFWSRWVSD